jgi:hypothetical protein
MFTPLRSWFDTYISSSRKRSRRPCRSRLSLESLESRCLLSNILVTNLGDSPTLGSGSLRAAIEAANAHPNSPGTVDTVTFSAALARTGGTIKLANGEIPITDGVAIAGPGNIKVDGQHLSRILDINIDPEDLSQNVAISKLTLQNGRVSGGFGGGIYADYVGKLTLTNVRIQGCESIAVVEGGGGEGGGIDVEMGDLILINSVITGNTATANSETYSFGRGGGINLCACATFSIQNSTISNNHADSLGGGMNVEGQGTITGSTLSGNICGGEGGGMAFDSTGTLAMTNCTLAKNQANSGGALYAIGFSIGEVTIQNSTIAQNTATTSVGGVFNAIAAMNLKNTIVAGNKQGTTLVDLRNDDGILNLSYCIVQSPGDLGTVTISHSLFGLGINVRLGPLAFNGGPTQTMALLPGSAAINAGDPNFRPPPSTDQRGPGYARVSGGRIDIGAFEVQAPAGTGHRGQRP